MNDENEEQQVDDHNRASAEPDNQPAPPPHAPDQDEIQTVSLLDLMAEAASHDGALPPPDSAAEAETQTLFPPESLLAADEEATLTEAPAPTQPARREPVPLPLAPEEIPPQTRPYEIDLEATEVQPRVAIPGSRTPDSEAPTRLYRPISQPESAGEQPTQVRPQRERPSPPPKRTPPPARTAVKVAIPTKKAAPPPKPKRRRDYRGCFMKLAVTSLIFLFLFLGLSIAAAFIGYRSIARDLPAVGDLEQKVSSFETARIYDRYGNEIYSLADPDAGNRTRVSLDEISPYLIQAAIATEDSRFYDNPGFDPIGLTRAIIQAVREGESPAGTSTITQQLVRAVLLDEEERTQRTIRRKVREIILAAELTRTYDKDTILELYLNEIYYGNLAYGIEAASQTYFDKSAKELTLAEASLLAGLPQAPAAWDPYTAPELAIGRQWEVLSLMLDEGYVTYEEAQTALNEMNMRIYQMTPQVRAIQYPHFVFTALQQAEQLLGAQAIYRGGLRIFTTMDPAAQDLAIRTLADNRGAIQAGGANNAALVAIKPDTGEVLSLVGSLDFFDETIDGQVNMALAPRQPGSSIKPLVYLSAMERGWTPSTLIWDVETRFPNGTNPPYVPKNYDDEFHGPLRLRPALGNSYNIPAVKALEFVGVCDFIANVQKIGLTALQDEGCAEVGQPRNYGLSLALGGGEVPPLQMAGAFAALANQGRYIAPYTISRIEDRLGNLLYEQLLPSADEAQVVREDHAYLLSSILSDNNARQPEFGVNNLLQIPGHRVAAKTGTSGSSANDVRDAWTIGYSPHVVTAVWVGNTGNEPIGPGQSGYRLASPIWNSFMSQYHADKQPLDFLRPPGIIDAEICADSGTRPGPDCPSRILEQFAGDQPPLDSSQDFLQKTAVDLWTNLRATDACPESVYEANFFNLLANSNPAVADRERLNAQRWLEQTPAGQGWASRRNIPIPLTLPPEQACDGNTPRPEISISQPQNNDEIIDSVEIRGTAKGPNFGGYQVEWGISHDPGGWGIIQERRGEQVDNNLLATWDLADNDYNGPLTVRVILFGPDNPYTPEDDPVMLEARVLLVRQLPTPTPTTTPTETPTATATGSPTPTTTTTATPEPSVTPTIAVTVSPTTAVASPTATTAVETPVSTPTETPTAASTPPVETPSPTPTIPPTATP
jgi:penicillin-binding protein 1C